MSIARVTADVLHVRKTPDLADNVIGFLHSGDLVEQPEISPDEAFSRIRKEDLAGWASRKWLTTVTSHQEYTVTSPGLNVRTEPRKAGNVIGQLAKGDVVTADRTSADGQWLHVSKGHLTGFASARFLRARTTHKHAAHSSGGDPKKPRWFEIAKHELHAGIAEVKGSGDNPRIVEYLKSTSLGKPMNQNDETFWCSAFVNFCVEHSGKDGTNSAMARSWMTWGHALKTPKVGCVAVFFRGSKAGIKGHVGFYAGPSGPGHVKILGGNQGDRVSIQSHPVSMLLGYRML
jgi:uncharacterized protein (TIGR02594 family)